MMAEQIEFDPRTIVVRSLAAAEDEAPESIEARIAVLGGDDDFFLDSKFAEAVIGYLQALTGRRLRGPADLPRSQYATVGALTEELRRQLR